MWNHLTAFLRLLARHASRRGLVDHKRSITTSSGREKPAHAYDRFRSRDLKRESSAIFKSISFIEFDEVIKLNTDLVGQIRPSGTLRRLPDAPHLAAHRACHMNEFDSIK